MYENNKIETSPWRTFSVFISSTFADMQAERDHLKHVIFHRVEEELQKKRIKLEIVDLRWGVDTTSMEQEDEREAGVLKVCLDEIKRCRPFFIGLLGDRYGWIPPVERIEKALASEDFAVKEKIRSVTALEIEFGVLATKEQLTRSVFYFRNPLPYEKFSAKKAASFSDKYNPQLSESEKTERIAALNELKIGIKNYFNSKNLNDKVKSYNAIWDPVKETVIDLDTWGDMIYCDIMAECKSHAIESWDKVPHNWQEQQLSLLDSFIEGHTHITTFITSEGEENIPTFCGRQLLINELKQHLLSKDDKNWGKVLTGESGAGKSALFSMLFKEMQKDECFILAHSAGLSPQSRNVDSLLLIWNKQLADFLRKEGELPGDTISTDDRTDQIVEDYTKDSTFSSEELQEIFRKYLQSAASKKRVVLIIDALDRFEPTACAQHLSWLPNVMPPNVRLLITAISGTELKAVKYHKGLKEKSIDSFSEEEAKEMLQLICKRQHKTLYENVVKIIMSKKRDDGQPATSNPLWVNLAVNMLMVLDSDDFEKISHLGGRADQQLESYLADMAMEFDPQPGKLFLSLVMKAGAVFGEAFTLAVFNYIACSRIGLREYDLEKLLPKRNIKWDSLLFANLRRWFKSHLILQGEELQWNLVHSILKNAILQQLSDIESKKIHFSIANHLLLLPDTDSLKISETFYHLMLADKIDMAAEYYGSYWWNTIQTQDSSKAIADAIIIDEAQSITVTLERILSLPEYVKNDDSKLHTMLINFIFSLYKNHLQNDTKVDTRGQLIALVCEQMGELCRRNPDSPDYAHDLSVSYDNMGDLYIQSGNLQKAIIIYQASLKIAENLHSHFPDSLIYIRDISISCDKLGDMYLQIGDLPNALIKYKDSLAIRSELLKGAEDLTDYTQGLLVSYNKLGDLFLKLGDHQKALEKYEASLLLNKELQTLNPESADYAHHLSISYERVGDLNLRLADLSKALDRYQSSLTIREELHRRVPDSAEYIFILSISYDKIADIFSQLGNLLKALDLYQTSRTLREELYRKAPDSADYARALSVSYNKSGDLYLELGNPQTALENYLMAFKIIERLRVLTPDSAEYACDLSYEYDKLGSIYLKMGDAMKSLDKYQASLKIREELCQLAPDSTDYTKNLSISYNKIGDIYLKYGDMSKALERYQASVTIMEELHRKAPESADYAMDLSISYERMSEAYLKAGDIPNALDKCQALTKIREELHHKAPDSAVYSSCVMVSYLNLGDLYLQLGDSPRALDKYNSSLTIAEELHHRVPESADYIRDLAILYDKLGDMYFSLRDIPKAFDKFQASLTLRKELCSRSNDSKNFIHDLTVSYDRLGDLYCQLGNFPEAHSKYQESLTIREKLYQGAPDSLEYARDLSVLYGKMGDLYLRTGDASNSLKEYQKELTIAEELYRKAPGSVEFALDLSVSNDRLGDLYLRLGDFPDTIEKYLASLTIRKELIRLTPDSAFSLRSLAISYYKIMIFQNIAGNQGEKYKYARLCKEVMLDMKNNGMALDEQMIQVFNQLQIY